ncbi:MAG: dicarboxylate/amino acid:cation symporter [Acidiferrobacteraceae bacterium]|jgi:Na+/H+-dicarboxylate symporter
MALRADQASRAFIKLSLQLQGLIHGRLWLQVIVGMVAGIGVGTLIGPTVGLVNAKTASIIGNWLALPGQLFLLIVQMIVMPLVFASVIRGLAAGGKGAQLRRMGGRIAAYFVATSATAITIGLAVTLLIQPGRTLDSALVKKAIGSGSGMVVTQLKNNNATLPSFGELPQKLLTVLPANPLTSMVEGQMLQVILFAIIVGAALVSMVPAQAKPLLDLLGSLQEVCMTIVKVAMRLAPFAVFGLLAQLTTKIGLSMLLGMGVYVGTVLIGLALLVCVYLTILWVATRTNPVRFLRATREVLLLAFSTSSSAAVMPLTLKTVEEKLNVKPAVSQFVIPLGTTINMDGTALYQGVAAIFLAQVFGVQLGVGAMLLIIITAVGASIGSPGTPGVGVVVLSLVLGSVGIPVAGIALIMGVDRLLDMSRTAVNVMGDMVASTVMARWTGESMESIGIAPQAVVKT